MPQKQVKKKNLKRVAKVKNQQKKPKNQPTTNKIVTRNIDASEKVLGRIATQIAIILRGKDKPTFTPNILMGDKVIVKNASKMIISGDKLNQKEYIRHTGYLGHLKIISLKEMMKNNPSEVLKRAVYGMLPKNKLRDRWIKNLKISN